MPVEVKRTLVKSPPELWAELSDPASLARHLDGFGEVRTVRTEPETTVEWEATDVRGTVEIRPSGWGTRVTLSVVREPPAPPPKAEAEAVDAEPPATQPEPDAGQPQVEPAQPEFEEAAQPEPDATRAKPDAAQPEVEATQPEVEATRPEPEVIEPEPAPAARRGFFARLFRRRRGKPEPEPVAPESDAKEPAVPAPMAEVQPEPAADPEPSAVPEAADPEPDSGEPAPPGSIAEVEPERAADAGPTVDIAAELAAVEEAMAEQDAALLSAVLDRLGAAHHRPFSRG
jgi:hypothetical protein